MQKITDEFIRTHFTEDAIENGMHLYEGAIEAALYIEKLCENNDSDTYYCDEYFDTYISSILGKRQGEYTVQDYCALPDDVRFELIDGVLIYMDSPHINHQLISGEIYYQISKFIHENKGKCKVFYAPVDVILDKDDKTCVQPDIGIFCDNNLISDKGTLYGAPDFVLEIISKSTSQKDYKLKLNKYKNAGVREYWIVDPYKEKVLVYFFENDINPTIYPMDAEIPIGIYEGKLNIVCNLQGEK